MTASNWEWKPRGVGDWLDGTFQVYRGGFRQFFGLAIAVALPVGIIQGFMLNSLTQRFMKLVPLVEAQGPEAIEPNVALSLFGQMSSWVLFGFVAYLAAIYLNVAGIWLVQRYLHQETGTAGQALKRSWVPFWRSIGMGIMRSLLESVVALVVGAVFVALGLGLQMGWLTVVGMILAAGVSVFLMIRFYLADQAIVTEDLGVFAAMRRSYRLTAGRFWATFGRLLLYGVMMMAIYMGLSVVVSLGSSTLGAVGLTALTIGAQGFQAVVRALLNPLGWIAPTLIYYDLRIRKEGYDLQQRVEGLEQEVAAPQA